MTPLFCPFCGNQPDKDIVKNNNVFRKYAVYCDCCEYFGPPGRTPELAIAAWNERHSPYQTEIDQLKKELAALREDKFNWYQKDDDKY